MDLKCLRDFNSIINIKDTIYSPVFAANFTIEVSFGVVFQYFFFLVHNLYVNAENILFVIA